MKLTIAERFALLGLLPKENNVLIMRRVQDLSKKLSLTNSEIRKCAVTALPDGKISWKDTEYTIDIDLGEIMEEEIKKMLKEKDEQKKITADLITLYDKVVEAPKETKKEKK